MSFAEIVENIGRVIDGAGVAIIAIGTVAAAVGACVRVLRREPDVYQRFRRQLGRTILLGLELLVAADIIRTVAVTPTLQSVAVLAGIVLIRTFLSFTLELEITGRWPWQKAPATAAAGRPVAARIVGRRRDGQDRGMRLVLLADTHVPRRARDLPDVVWAAVDAADVVVHAGDWVSDEFYDVLLRRSRRLVACHGNNDTARLHAVLPRVARVELDGLRLGVVHETGQAQGRERRCDAEHRGPGRARVRAQPHPVGLDHPGGCAPAQPGLADGPTTPALRDVHHRGRAVRRARRRGAAPHRTGRVTAAMRPTGPRVTLCP